jgi:methylglutaconyl-CoA hydratase
MHRENSDGWVRTETHEGVTTIEFFHPQSNSMPGLLLEGLSKEIRDAGNDPGTRVIVLRSGGTKAFCAGASFDELMAIENADQGFSFFSGFAHLINAIRKCPKFVIARIHGKCVGGGVGIAAAADYAIAAAGADVKLSELAFGIGPFVVGPAVERKIGASAFSSLAIDATSWRDAEWATKHGLYAGLHAQITELDESVARLANTLAQSSPEAMSLLKAAFWKGTEHWDQLLVERAAISGRLILSEFSQTALRNFRKK